MMESALYIKWFTQHLVIEILSILVLIPRLLSQGLSPLNIYPILVLLHEFKWFIQLLVIEIFKDFGFDPITLKLVILTLKI